VEESDGDERVDGVGDELLLGEYELVVLELVLLQKVSMRGRVGFSFFLLQHGAMSQ
jgi:hypothetical protein